MTMLLPRLPLLFTARTISETCPVSEHAPVGVYAERKQKLVFGCHGASTPASGELDFTVRCTRCGRFYDAFARKWQAQKPQTSYTEESVHIVLDEARGGASVLAPDWQGEEALPPYEAN